MAASVNLSDQEKRWLVLAVEMAYDEGGYAWGRENLTDVWPVDLLLRLGADPESYMVQQFQEAERLFQEAERLAKEACE